MTYIYFSFSTNLKSHHYVGHLGVSGDWFSQNKHFTYIGPIQSKVKSRTYCLGTSPSTATCQRRASSRYRAPAKVEIKSWMRRTKNFTKKQKEAWPVCSGHSCQRPEFLRRMDGLAHRPSNPPAITESGSSLFQINQNIILWNYLKMKLSRLFKTEVLFLPQVVVMVFPHLADCKDRGNQNRSISQMVTKSPPLVLLPNVFLQLQRLLRWWQSEQITLTTIKSHLLILLLNVLNILLLGTFVQQGGADNHTPCGRESLEKSRVQHLVYV